VETIFCGALRNEREHNSQPARGLPGLDSELARTTATVNLTIDGGEEEPVHTGSVYPTGTPKLRTGSARHQPFIVGLRKSNPPVWILICVSPDGLLAPSPTEDTKEYAGTGTILLGEQISELGLRLPKM